jgi:hypothetical protein
MPRGQASKENECPWPNGREIMMVLCLGWGNRPPYCIQGVDYRWWPASSLQRRQPVATNPISSKKTASARDFKRRVSKPPSIAIKKPRNEGIQSHEIQPWRHSQLYLIESLGFLRCVDSYSGVCSTRAINDGSWDLTTSHLSFHVPSARGCTASDFL